MRLKKMWIFLALMLFAVSASAEFYKYVDENGRVRYTDDLSQIPEDQRKSVPGYAESQGQPAPAEASSPSVPSSQASDVAADQDENVSTEASLEQRRRNLQDRRKALDAEYEAITREEAELRDHRKRVRSKAKVRQYNERREALNARITKYKADKAAFEADVRTYNADLDAFRDARSAE